MTAEIAILNLEAVALAADSAVTITGEGGQKIYTTANKIFQLSRTRPVAVMVWDAAALTDMAWETIIKRYRDALGSRSFDTLDEYVEDFLAFIDARTPAMFPAQIQQDRYAGSMHAFLSMIAAEIDAEVDRRLSSGAVLDPADVPQIIDEVVTLNHDLVMAGDLVPGLPPGYVQAVRGKYSRVATERITAAMGALPVSTGARRKLRRALFNLPARIPRQLIPPFRSGVVVTGFGDEDLYPRLRAFTFEGVVADYAKRYEEARFDISPTGVRSTVVPFAQREMVDRFMEGVDPDYQEVVESLIEEVLNQYPSVLLAGLPRVSARVRTQLLRRAQAATPSAMQSARDHLAEVRKEAFWRPVAQLVNFLPKEEIAGMAEALVNLTSFKRKVSWEAETVGGPIDVAVISRGDGFVWIKRKHYFSAELNPGFIGRRYGGRR